MIVAVRVVAGASLVNAVGYNVFVLGGENACVMWLRVCCLRCAMAVVWLRRCNDDEDGVAAPSLAVNVVWAMCCVRNDNDDDDATMVDDSA